MPKVFPDVLTKCDYISNNLNYIMAKNILCIKNVCYNNNVNLHLHSSTLVDAVKNDWASHLAFHIKVIREVMRNFMNSFMKHPLQWYNASISLKIDTNLHVSE